MSSRIIVKVSKPAASVMRRDGRFFVHSETMSFNYRGPIPIWVEREVSGGRHYFIIQPTHGAPEFIQVAEVTRRW